MGTACCWTLFCMLDCGRQNLKISVEIKCCDTREIPLMPWTLVARCASCRCSVRELLSRPRAFSLYTSFGSDLRRPIVNSRLIRTHCSPTSNEVAQVNMDVRTLVIPRSQYGRVPTTLLCFLRFVLQVYFQEAIRSPYPDSGK